jgi:uncharacterized protein (DUF488 family)
VDIYTIGFTRKSAADFFGALRGAAIRRLVDIRISNASQLAGFTKKDHLPFFLEELCGAEYVHEPRLAPTLELMLAVRKRNVTWAEYEQRFLQLLHSRRVDRQIGRDLFDVPTVLLCTEPTAERCHRRLVVEYLGRAWGNVTPRHL